MGDIRKKILDFAKSSEGKRIWARTHPSYNENKNGVRSFDPLVKTFSYKKQSYKCSHFVTKWEQGTNDIIYSDRDPENDFKKTIEKKAKERCHIGYGECWDLAYVALYKNNGLKTLITYGSQNRKWSNDRVKSLKEIRGGEIIELAKFFTLTITKISGEETSISCEFSSIENEHTAIIGSKVSEGRITVYQQNAGNIRVVHKSMLPISNIKNVKGNKTIYQICGGNEVKKLIEQAKMAGSSFAKLENLIPKVEAYIKSTDAIPSQIKIYIPMSN